MSAPVAGPSAGALDVRRRLITVASVVAPIALALVLLATGIPGAVIAIIALVLFVALFIASIVVGSRVTRVMRRELEAGYSSLYDVADYDLRDARTLELLRPASTPPTSSGRRSLVAGMFRVKSATLLSQRLRDED